TMFDGDVIAVCERGRFFDDARELALGHRAVGAVLDARDVAFVVHLAHSADEEHRCAIRVTADALEYFRYVDWRIDDGRVHVSLPQLAESTRLRRLRTARDRAMRSAH